MKRISLFSLIAASLVGAAIQSCKGVEARQVLEDYTACFSYVTDTYTGQGFVDTGSSYVITGNPFEATYGVELNNVRFFEGAEALSAKVSGLLQYFSPDSTYVFMLQRLSSYSWGEFDVDSLHYGVVGNIWLEYIANNRYAVNVMPTNYNIGTDSVQVYKYLPSGGISHRLYYDFAIENKYNITLDPDNSTLTMQLNGQKFEHDGKLHEVIYRDIPVSFNPQGYTIHVDKVVPVDLRGNAVPELTAYNMDGTMTMTYEGRKYLQFDFCTTDPATGAIVPDRQVQIVFFNHSMGQR